MMTPCRLVLTCSRVHGYIGLHTDPTSATESEGRAIRLLPRCPDWKVQRPLEIKLRYLWLCLVVLVMGWGMDPELCKFSIILLLSCLHLSTLFPRLITWCSIWHLITRLSTIPALKLQVQIMSEAVESVCNLRRLAARAISGARMRSCRELAVEAGLAISYIRTHRYSETGHYLTLLYTCLKRTISRVVGCTSLWSFLDEAAGVVFSFFSP